MAEADASDVLVDYPDEHRYELHRDGQLAALTVYRDVDGVMEFVHTETRDGFEGQGAAGAVVRFALDDVRNQGRSIRPYCPYVRGFIERHGEYVDLVPAAERADFGLT